MAKGGIKMKKLLITVSMVVALGACSRGGGTPAGVVEEFMRKMESGSCSGLGDYLSAQSKAVAGPKLEQGCTAAAEMRKADPSKGKSISSINVLEAKEEGDRATVRLEAQYSDGTKEGGDPIVLVRENGAWKIDLLAGMSGGPGGGGMGPAPTAPTPGPMAPAPGPMAPAPTMTPAPATPAPATPAPAETPAPEPEAE